jgi:DNA-binding NarL/FixJ family response regulator
MKVLLVDDNALFLASAQRFLANFAAVGALVTARDGFEALEKIGRDRPDLVLIDLNMPRMNGFETTRRIKALDPSIRVIVVSLHDAPDFQTAATIAGAERFIAKQEFAAQLPALLSAAKNTSVAAAADPMQSA